jgi:hypothetical protein
MKTKEILSLLVMIVLCSSGVFSQNKYDAQKEFENNLKNALIQGVVDAVTGNTSSEPVDPKSLLPGGGNDGFMFLTNGTMKDFIGIRYIGMNSEYQSNSNNGKPLVWIVDNNNWRSVYLSDVASITYNNLEYITARNYKLSVSVMLKDGNTYNYDINPARNTITILIPDGNYYKEEQIQVFNPGQIFINNIIFY